ncbi:AAA family ATPase [Peribacillus frigoritolerans]|uniref:AAA family ATPase n=1 Tax=Peribacillus frigoritolerans TaxID=450367 RepID=A0AAJ1QLT7_9BACI|nr:ATP-binding protein [Peribacillus frigoritolerans]MDM5283773.1 AAA family ATPase [Peribacillus frigoritolerans]
MRIKKLKINHYRGLDDVQITFLKPKNNYFGNLEFSVLVGENGTGKTSILRALTKIFCPSRNVDSREDRETIDFKIRYEINNQPYNYNSNQRYPDIYPSKVIVSSFAVFDPYMPVLAYRPRERERTAFNQESDFVYCGPKDSFVNNNKILIRSLIHSITYLSGNHLNWKAFSKLMDRLSITKILYLELDREMSRYVNPHDIPEGDHLLSKSPEIREQGRDNLRMARQYRIPGNAGLNLRNGSFLIDVETFKESLGELQRLYELQSEMDMKTFIRDIWFEKEGKPVSLSDLSSGEITMLFRFLPLLMEVNNNSIILIDEPETHLHPVWIQQFISYLVDIFHDFHSHFILATHSPLIVTDLPIECIVGLEKYENKVQQYLLYENTLGGDPSDLLKEVFELKSLQGDFTVELLKEVLGLLESGEADKIAKARQIYNDLSITSEKHKLFMTYRKYLEE